MNVMPELTESERRFVREIVSGAEVYEAYTRTHTTQGSSPQSLGAKSQQLRKAPRIQIWVDYLRNASPEQVIEQTYLSNLAFGDSEEAMKASKAYLDSRFAGKEVAQIFWRTLEEIGAEIFFHCDDCGQEHRAPVRAKGATGG
jgi:hypothetical protein